MHQIRICDHSNPEYCNHGYETFGNYRWADRKGKRESARERAAFNSVRRAEIKYSRQLRSVAEQIGIIIRTMSPNGVADVPLIEATMEKYSIMLKPWAKAVGAGMLADVSRRDEAVWASLSRDMSYALREEIKRAPTGEALKRLLDEQVNLITSLPTRAAQRVHKLALEARVDGSRASSIAKEIMRSGDVTKSRANLIARTEVARTASGLVQARATYVGSEGYIWRTAQDSDVRKSHKKMSGKFVRWDQPPVTDNLVGHAGQLPNCRCYPEPVLPEVIN